ncbi:MAG: Unknown protein [uncultured Thiotrichaceae bacterium]|uniref:Uncharacterized protein n=1 Tax=uncultured Thiotrichaceae bacterium TaxID=298394 RepID=A0A6S6T6A6_9GAMM|nr:MAG: Unknown protein [uncultured Thiotrichaceae bacterium]
MSLYAIYLFEGDISLYDFTDGKSSPVKNMGELKQKFEFERFWTWWKTKVEYRESDEFAFIIFTDLEEFQIPQDILITKKVDVNPLKKLQQYAPMLPKNVKIFTQPASIFSDITFQKEASKKRNTKVPLANGSLEDYFVKETLRFKAEA